MGTSADVLFVGGPPNGTFLSLVTTQLLPVPLAGGTLIDPAPDFLIDAPDRRPWQLLPARATGGPGPATLYLQAAFVDPVSVPNPPHVGLSNGVRIDLP